MNDHSFSVGANVTKALPYLVIASLLAGCSTESYYVYPDVNGIDHTVTDGEITILEVAEDLAESACALYAECDALQGYGGGESGCQDAVVDYYLDLDESGQCDLNIRAADQCLEELDTMACNDLESEWSRHSACYQICGAVPVWAIL